RVVRPLGAETRHAAGAPGTRAVAPRARAGRVAVAARPSSAHARCRGRATAPGRTSPAHAGIAPVAQTQVTDPPCAPAENLAETVGDKLGFMSRLLTGDLERLKQFVESRGRETGA